MALVLFCTSAAIALLPLHAHACRDVETAAMRVRMCRARAAPPIASSAPTEPAIATSFSLSEDTEKAVEEAYAQLLEGLGGGEPSLLITQLTATHSQRDVVVGTLRKLTGDRVPFAGGTSCGGVMTERGFHRNPAGGGTALGMWAVRGGEALKKFCAFRKLCGDTNDYFLLET